MKTTSAALGAILLATTAATAPASAHHSFAAEFDVNKPVRLDGTVAEFEWVNPHSWLHIDVVNAETGETERWKVEGGAPSPLLRRGWTKNTLQPGTRVTVDGFQARDGDRRMNASDVTFPDGKTMFFGTTGIGAPYEEREGGAAQQGAPSQ